MKTIRELPIFKNSSNEFIDKFTTIAKAKTAPKGETILEQGIVNERFLILVSGAVEVIVKGEIVAVLDTPGDLMGEMSALTGWIVTASLRAMNEVQYFDIPAKELKNRVEQSKDNFGYELYELLAQVLSLKIIRTNEKARQFEIANRNLSVTMDLLQETQRTIDRRVRERMIGNALQGRRILVVEAERKQQSLAKISLGGLGSQIDFAVDIDEAMALIDSGLNYDLTFLNLPQAEKLSILKQKMGDKRIVVVGSHDKSKDIEIISEYTPMVSNLITKNPDDRDVTVRNMTLAATKLLSADLFGLEKYLIWGVEVQSKTVYNSEQRAALVAEMQEYFKDLGIRSTIGERAGLVAEEVLMNAVYDAPVDEDGRPVYNHLPRTQQVELNKNQEAEFRYACDGMMAALSVSDQSGTLSIEVLVDYLKRNLRAETADLQLAGKGGAGRGLYTIIESADLVIFNVQPKKKTEVIALFNLDPRSKDSATSPLFHFFVL